MSGIYRIANGETVKIDYRDHGDAAHLLNTLHDYYNLSWPKIATLPTINPPGRDPIPVATLARIAETGIVPKKWRGHFPGVRAIDKRKRISISKTDMRKAANTIRNNIEPDQQRELVELLSEAL